MSARDHDEGRYGRGLAGILRALEDGTATPDDAARLRAELDVYRHLLNAHERDAQQRNREQLHRTRLEHLMDAGARPVRGGVLWLIDGGRGDA